MKTPNIYILLLALVVSAQTQERLPVIDMHLHAFTADNQGPPPLCSRKYLSGFTQGKRYEISGMMVKHPLTLIY